MSADREVAAAARLGRIAAEKNKPELWEVVLDLIGEDTWIGEPSTVRLMTAYRDAEQDVRNTRAEELRGYQDAGLRERDIT